MDPLLNVLYCNVPSILVAKYIIDDSLPLPGRCIPAPAPAFLSAGHCCRQITLKLSNFLGSGFLVRFIQY